MTQTLFFVTALDGVEKHKFKAQLRRALNDNKTVSIMVSILNFEETVYTMDTLNQIVDELGSQNQVAINNLFEYFQNKRGISDDGIQQKLNLDKYQQKEEKENGVTKESFVDDEGRVIAEKYAVDSHKDFSELFFYDGADVTAEIYLGPKQKPLAYKDIDKKNKSQLKFLNQRGEAAASFDYQRGGTTKVYNLNKTAVISAPAGSREYERKQDALLSSKDQHPMRGNQKFVLSGKKNNSYVILDYSTGSRFENLASFNVSLINQLASKSETLFIDLRDTLEFAPYLNRQVIFNY